MSDDRMRIPLPPAVAATRLVVAVSAASLHRLTAVIEVLIQEGLGVISVPADGQIRPSELRGMFGRRLTIGVHDVRDVARAEWAIEEQAALVSHLHCPGAGAVFRSAGIADAPGALTPNEVAAAWDTGAAAVQVVPANLLGNFYPQHLAELVPQARLMARGVDTVHEVKAWLAAGAVACYLGDRLLGDALTGGDLAKLRARARPLVAAAAGFPPVASSG